MVQTAYKNLSDEDLLLRMTNRQDQDAFATLYKRYAHLALGVCLKYLRDAAASEDAVQVIFVKLWTDCSQHQVRKFKPWFYQVVRNHCLMELRKKNPSQKTVAEWEWEIVEFEENLHHKIKEEELLQILEDCLRRLNEEQKSCINHFYLSQKSYSETAVLTGFNDKQVKSNIQNGRRNLRICLKQKWNNQQNT